MSASKPDNRRPVTQRGSSLVVTMIMLVVLMLMGVTAVVVSNAQYRMAGNLQFQNLAMNNAESAVAQAESWASVNFNNNGFKARVSGGLYPEGSNPDPYTMTWDDTTSVKLDLLGGQRYMIELMGPDRILPSNSLGVCNPYGLVGPCPRVNIFRITGRGASIRGSIKLVQSVFAVRANL